MKILAVDDKPAPRRALVKAIQDAAPDAEVVACANADEALALSDVDAFDVAFVDVDMPGINGVELARRLKAIRPQVNIAFATGYGEYMADAFELHSSGYLMKPITAKKVAAELDNLRFSQRSRDDGKLLVQCFGNFEVFAHGEPVPFSRMRAKELFAYLIDRRGALCSNADIELALWEDGAGRQSLHSYMRTLVADMRRSLSAVGHGDVIVKQRGSVGIRPDLVTCDYYAFLEGEPLAVASYQGEYMRQYSWAEETLAQMQAALV